MRRRREDDGGRTALLVGGLGATASPAFWEVLGPKYAFELGYWEALLNHPVN